MKLIDRLRRKDPFSLRTKLILSFIVIIFVGGSGTTILGTRLVANTLIRQAQRKVTHDLASAWMIYNEKLNEIKIKQAKTGSIKLIDRLNRKYENNTSSDEH